MNEYFFTLHIFVLVSFILFSLKLGKEALTACFILQVILANLFVTKQMTCFALQITCTDAYTVGALFSLSLLQEYFGKKYAKRTIWTLFLSLLFFIMMSYIHLKYHPSQHDHMHLAFTSVLKSIPRIVFASFFVTLLTQKLDIELFGLLKKKFPDMALLLRFCGTSLLTQLVDTLLFSFIALYGLVHNIRDVILVSYLIKVIIISCITPATILAKRFIQRAPIQI